VKHAVVVENVHKRFRQVHALQGVDLQIPSGATFGLVGPNGAGKTTLFSIIAGFLRPSSGQVKVLGGSGSGEELRGALSVLPQDATWRKGTAIHHQMALCARLQGMSPKDADLEVRRVLEQTGMLEHYNRSPETLSHGMAKRVAISQALIGDPQVVMLDEPLAGLDPVQARQVRLLVQQQSGDRTFVISSHNMSDIEALCSHVAIIKQGRIVAQPSMEDLTHREAVAVFTLKDKPTEALAAHFEALDFVSKAEVRTDERKLQLTVLTDRKDLDAAVGEFIQILVAQQASFVSVQKGTSLEDAVIGAS
jgi:ABC-2 type transport system ATP-binding protein